MKHLEDCLKQKSNFPCCEDQMCPCDQFEFNRLKVETAKYREALENIFTLGNMFDEKASAQVASEALKGEE